MARRLSPALILVCAALAAPSPHRRAPPTCTCTASRRAEPRQPRRRSSLATKLQDGEGVETGRRADAGAARPWPRSCPSSTAPTAAAPSACSLRPTQGQGNPGEETYTVPEAAAGLRPPLLRPLRRDDRRTPRAGRRRRRTAAPTTSRSMLREFENVYDVENGQLGWRAPEPDRGRGGDDRTDVYIKNIGPERHLRLRRARPRPAGLSRSPRTW